MMPWRIGLLLLLLYFVDAQQQVSIVRTFTPTVTYSTPSSISIDSINNLVYVADAGNHRIVVVNRTSNIATLFAGNGTGGYNGDSIAATSALLYNPQGVAVDSVNNLVYISDFRNNRIRVVNRTTGNITTFAGTGSIGYSGDNGPATSAQLSFPRTIAIDAASNLVYIADTYNYCIRVVNRATNVITTFAGTSASSYNGDNINATSANLGLTYSVAIDNVNNLVYISEYNNQRIRVVNRTSGIINTFAGNGTQGFSGDNGPAVLSQIYNPCIVEVDAANNLVYIADSYNYRIRVVNRTSQNITTYAGMGPGSFVEDSPVATAKFSLTQ
ncbi:NHL repeat-containing protein, partial [Acrasis kona]